MVRLARAAYRVVAEMRIDQIHAAYQEPVADPLEVLKSRLPSRGAVSLAEGALPAELVGDALDLQEGAVVSELGVRSLGVPVHQAVDARNVLPPVETHHIGPVADPGPAMFPHMSCRGDPPRFALAKIGFGEIFQIEIEQHCGVVVAHPAPVARVEMNGRKEVDDRVPEAGLEGGRESGRPSAGDVRLVGEAGLNRFSILVGEHPVVSSESDLQEFLPHPRPQKIDEEPAGQPRRLPAVRERIEEIGAPVEPEVPGGSGFALVERPKGDPFEPARGGLIVGVQSGGLVRDPHAFLHSPAEMRFPPDHIDEHRIARASRFERLRSHDERRVSAHIAPAVDERELEHGGLPFEDNTPRGTEPGIVPRAVMLKDERSVVDARVENSLVDRICDILVDPAGAEFFSFEIIVDDNVHRATPVGLVKAHIVDLAAAAHDGAETDPPLEGIFAETKPRHAEWTEADRSRSAIRFHGQSDPSRGLVAREPEQGNGLRIDDEAVELVRSEEGPFEGDLARRGHPVGHVAAREAGGVAVLVVDVCHHAALLALRRGEAPEFEPSIGKVRRDQARPGMDEDPAETGGTEPVELPGDLLLVEQIVPHVEGRRPERGRRIAEPFQHRVEIGCGLVDRVLSKNLARTQDRDCEGDEKGEKYARRSHGFSNAVGFRSSILNCARANGNRAHRLSPGDCAIQMA